MSPAVENSAPCITPDWNRASRDIESFAHAEINRVYGPYGSDTRYHFRMETDHPPIYRHVIYDACAGKVLGEINLGWMDWTVDLHHNLLNGKAGRQWAGFIGILMLVSSVSGIFLWFLGRPNIATLFRVRLGWSRAAPREIHRAMGVGAAILLGMEAFTGLWLTFPQTMRSALTVVGPVEENVRPAKAKKTKSVDSTQARLGDWIAAAEKALPDGRVEEIRMPEENAYAQIRMWRPGDFRSLGNNVVFVRSSGAQVIAVDRYGEHSGSNRFIQAMAGLHYDEWGGTPFRLLAALAGFVTPLLYLSGILIWWYSRKRGRTPTRPRSFAEENTAVGVG